MVKSLYLTALAVAMLGLAASGAEAQVCIGNCGILGADGVVTAPPNGELQYRWVSTDGGVEGVNLGDVGYPTGSEPDGPQDGSSFTSSMFAASDGDALEFYFNYVTSDGAGYADYAWARLLNADMSEAALLFTARTTDGGSMVPGEAMPTPAATLTPASATVNLGTTWSPLGGNSGECYDVGCGHSGWIFSEFTIAAAGNYFLEFGVTNWDDQAFDSGLAWSGTTIGSIPIDPIAVPEPASMLLLASGLLGLGFVARRRREDA